MSKSSVRPRLLPGLVARANKNCIEWGCGSGLLAFGSQMVVVVVDPGTDGLRVVQTLDGCHRAAVVKVRTHHAGHT